MEPTLVHLTITYKGCIIVILYCILCKYLKKTLQNQNVLFAKYDVQPEVPLQVLASNTKQAYETSLLVVLYVLILTF